MTQANSSSMLRELLHLGLGLLQLVDLGVDGLEPFGVVGAVVLAAGHVGDLLQRVLVNVHRLHLVDHLAGRTD